MKQYIIIFLMLIGIGGASAGSYSQNTTLSLKLRNKALKNLFWEIEKQSEYIFFYNDEAVNVNKTVSISVDDVTINEVLDKVLDKRSKYVIIDRQVILFKNEKELETVLTVASTAQSKPTVKGRIKSNTGESLIGVSVLEKGTTNGTVSDFNGDYLLEVSQSNATLVFSYIGFEMQEIALKNRDQLNVTLQEDIAGLDEVIVVAYGTQKKSSVTGSIAVVNAEKLKTATSPNVNTMLQGKVPGVQVLNQSGKPGEAATIRIRGKGTLNSSVDPLWVVDGVVSGTGAQLNPNEIETISVLKDAAATALYGSRATNGVILVTTKSGRMGESKINVSAKFSISQQNLGKFKLMNARELYDYTEKMDGKEASGILSWFNNDLLAHDTDWFDLATQAAFMQNYTISYTMGNDKVRSFLSGDFYNEEGTVKGFDYNRYSLRSNIDYYVNKKLTLKTKISGTYQNDQSQEHSLYSAMTYLPWDYPHNADGSLRTGLEEDWRGRDRSNYLYNLQWNWGRSKQLGVSASAGMEYKITDYLTFESNNNIGYRYVLSESYNDPRAIGASEYDGSIENANQFVTTRYANQLLRFNKIFDRVHTIGAFLGYEYSDYKYERNGSTGRGIPQGGEVLDVSSSPYKVTGEKQEWAMQSFYFNANYTYNDKYMAQFSYRLDGSSRFGKENRYGGFFTVGGAWSVHNENFLAGSEIVNQLKLRVSFGSIGNTPGGGNYGYLSVYSLDTHYNGKPAAFPKRLGNPDLTWEKCYETNVGIDTRLLDRISISAEYYYKNTSDLLYLVPLTSLTGYESQYRNVGAVTNEGFELSISPDLIKTKDFQWTIDLNMGYNRSKIKELYEGQQQISNLKILEEGSEIDTWYLYDWAGVDQYTGNPMWYIHNDDGSTTLTSDYEKASRIKAGSAIPKYTGGIMNSFTYKDFTLSAMFSFVAGNKIYHYAREFYDNDGAYPSYNSMKLRSGWSRWEKPGDIATHPRAVANGNNNSNKPSTRYLERGDYFRMNNLTLSYTIPGNILKRVGIQYGNVSLSGENLFTITKFSGTDAELGAGTNNSTPGADLYPSVRRFSLGLNFTF